MLFDRVRRPRPVAVGPRKRTFAWRLRSKGARRLSWGVVDQAVSSLTNAAVSIYVARTLGAVQFGAFSIAYVTFAFALNASRGLSTDPLMVRFSGAELPAWRRATASCTGTAAVVGLVAGACVMVVAMLLSGTTRAAFLALGLTMPGLLLQDSWRYAFFALGRGFQAVLNDLACAVLLIPALFLLRKTGHADVFWFVFAWGMASAVAAVLGPLQARVVPKLPNIWVWVLQHRDLGFRYVAEGTSSSASGQLRTYGIGLILGLATVGYVGASATLMGPMTILLLGMSLVAIPEAARVLQRSPQRLPLFCLLVSGALSAAALLWGVVLLVALPRGLGAWLLGSIWRPTYPLVLPQMLSVIGQCVGVGAAVGLHGLGAARRSLRAAILSAVTYVVCSLAGAVMAGAIGTVLGSVVATWTAALVLWWQLRTAIRESGKVHPNRWFPASRPAGRHAKSAAADSSR